MIDTRIDPGPLLVDGKEACRRLSIGRSKLYELVAIKQIPSVKIDSLRRYRVTDLEAYAERLADAS